MESIPKGSRFLRLNTNDKAEAAALDVLLDGSGTLPINGVQVNIADFRITKLEFTNYFAYVVLSPAERTVSAVA
jgi:hypothetical protein